MRKSNRFAQPFIKLLFGLAIVLCPIVIQAQADETHRQWNQPVKPYRVIGNIYYVGANEIASFLITTPQGHILLEGGFAETVPQIEANVTTLGFKLSDIKILLTSQAHFDHAAGLARLKELTGARMLASEADAALLARGGRDDFAWGDRYAYEPVKTDRIIRDEEKIELGGVTLTVYLTPGHTKGSTTYTMKVREGGREYDVVFAVSTTAPGYQLLNNPKYPKIVADFADTFRRLKTLPCDVFLGAHSSFFGMAVKLARREKGEAVNPFIDPAGYRRYLERTERAFQAQLEKERQATGGK